MIHISVIIYLLLFFTDHLASCIPQYVLHVQGVSTRTPDLVRWINYLIFMKWHIFLHHYKEPCYHLSMKNNIWHMYSTTCSLYSHSINEICDKFYTDLLLDLADDTSSFERRLELTSKVIRLLPLGIYEIAGLWKQSLYCTQRRIRLSAKLRNKSV